jgi:hypothetical protein
VNLVEIPNKSHGQICSITHKWMHMRAVRDYVVSVIEPYICLSVCLSVCLSFCLSVLITHKCMHTHSIFKARGGLSTCAPPRNPPAAMLESQGDQRRPQCSGTPFQRRAFSAVRTHPVLPSTEKLVVVVPLPPSPPLRLYRLGTFPGTGHALFEPRGWTKPAIRVWDSGVGVGGLVTLIVNHGGGRSLHS